MPEIDHDKSQLGFMPMLRITWGINEFSEVARYVRADEDQSLYDAVTDQAETWIAVPEMDIEFETQDGGTQAKPVRITVPVTTYPINQMIAETFGPTEIAILEGDFTDLTAEPRLAYIGQIAKTKARFKGKSQLVEVELQGRKLFMKDVSLGIKATDRCPWFFGDHICGFALAANSCTVTSLAGTKMTVSSLFDGGLPPYEGVAGIFTRGFVEHRGLRILIRQQNQSQGSTDMILAKAAPQSGANTWLNQVINAYKGCDKSVAACVYWGREASFGGIGLLMPKYDPFRQNRPEGGGPAR